MESASEPRHHRAIWISDVHLGSRGCKAEFLLDFLKHNESDYLYLVGDIIDGWALRRTWMGWKQSHNDVIQKVLRKARKGTKVVYIPGNHDELARQFLDMHFGEVHVLPHTVHETADGRRFFVTHGDQFDGVMQCAEWLAKLGCWAYDLSVILNHWLNIVRRNLGYPYWSLSGYLKHKVKNAGSFIEDFRRIIVQDARRRELDGVICGHIHFPEMREVEGTLYINDGDWVENCTALVEDASGKLEIVKWTTACGSEPSSQPSGDALAVGVA